MTKLSSTFQIPTSQPGLGLDLLEVDINGAATGHTWSGTGDYAGISVSFIPVPEASSYVAGLGLLLPVGLQAIRRMRQGKQVA